jgi:predicted Ser/Thr protein kinase
MTRSQIEFSFDISGKKGKEGTTFRAGQYAVKLFKSTKSKAKLVLEADLQKLAARYGVAPSVHYVSTTQKFIVMDALEETIVEKGKREEWTRLP